MKTCWIVACAGALLWGSALAESEIHCEVSSSNFAWGPHYGGMVIAPSGDVALFEYDFAKSPRDRDDELFGEHWLTPTRQDLVKRFRPGRRVVGTLCPDRRAWLRDQLDVVRTAGRSKVVDMQSRDGPTAYTHCFVFETGHDAATFVFLQRSGDSESHSLSPAAPRLANWLSAVSAEARRRADLPAKGGSCIDDLPPLTEPIYRDAVAEVRQRTMEELQATRQLHCQFAEGNSNDVDGEQRGNWDAPARLSVVFSDLDSVERRGRAAMFGNDYPVRIDTTVVGLTLTNTDVEKNRGSDVVTIVPYRIGGRAIYPALKHEIRLHDRGAVAVRYAGECAALPLKAGE
jgi:hypothetical protein